MCNFEVTAIIALHEALLEAVTKGTLTVLQVQF